jgi:autotransporter-associated beta strand protein
MYSTGLILTGTSNSGFSGTITTGATLALANEALLGTNANALTMSAGILGDNGSPLTIATHSIALTGGITVSPTNATGDMTLTGGITGTGSIIYRSQTTRAIVLGGTNSYNGTSEIYTDDGNNSTLRMGATNALPSGTGKGNLQVTAWNNGGTATLDLNGYSQTVNGLISNGNSAGSKRTIDNVTAGGNVTLTVGAANATGHTFDGVIKNTSGTLNLVKTGSGTQALTGTNTYTGNTTVSGGTLSLGNGTANTSLADASTVTIADGAVLKLNFSSGNPDTVNKLYLGTPAAQVPAGTYNASTPTYGVYFTGGAGSLVVTAGPSVSAYDTWLALYPSLTGANQLPGADPDGDGLTNQQEFAFGLNPTSGASVNPILVPLDKTAGTFSYQRRASSGLTYKILTSTDLLTWPEDSGATASQSAGAVDGNGNQAVVVTLSGAIPLTAPKLFIRVAAE